MTSAADGPIDVVVGVIGRAHGLRGEVAIELRTDEPERRFAPGAVLRAEDGTRELTVASRRDASGRCLVQFAGAEDRTVAETLRGTVLVAAVPPSERPTEDGEFYDRQLVGLRVLDQTGTTRGAVSGVVHLPSQDLLEIQTDTELRLVPFVAALVPEVDLTEGFVRVAAVAGLLADDPDDEPAERP